MGNPVPYLYGNGQQKKFKSLLLSKNIWPPVGKGGAEEKGILFWILERLKTKFTGRGN